MNEFTDTEIIKVLDKMIGCTEPQGDSALDSNVNENLQILFGVADWCLDSVFQAAEHRKSYAYSEKYAGDMAYREMVDWKERLEEKVAELE